MSANFALVVHAAQGHAHKLAAGGAGNRLAQARLAHAGRAHQAQNRGLHLVDPALHGQVLEDALLDLLKPPVVLVENPGGLAQVGRHLGLLLPGQLKQRIEVAANHGRLGAHGLHHAQLLQFGLRLLLGLLGHAGGGNAVAIDVEVVPGASLLASELLLNGLHLLVEVVVALALLHLLLDAPLDALLHGKNVHLAGEKRQQVVEALLHVGLLKQLLLALDGQREVAGDGVGKLACGRHGVDRVDNLLGELFALARIVVETLEHRAARGLENLGVALGRVKPQGLGGVARRPVLEIGDLHALMGLDEHLQGAVGELEHLQHGGVGAHRVEIAHRGIIRLAVALGDEDDLVIAAHSLLDSLHRLRATDEQRQNHPRKHNKVANGKQGRHDHGGNGIISCHVRVF